MKRLATVVLMLCLTVPAGAEAATPEAQVPQGPAYTFRALRIGSGGNFVGGPCGAVREHRVLVPPGASGFHNFSPRPGDALTVQRGSLVVGRVKSIHFVRAAVPYYVWTIVSTADICRRPYAYPYGWRSFEKSAVTYWQTFTSTSITPRWCSDFPANISRIRVWRGGCALARRVAAYPLPKWDAETKTGVDSGFECRSTKIGGDRSRIRCTRGNVVVVYEFTP